MVGIFEGFTAHPARAIMLGLDNAGFLLQFVLKNFTHNKLVVS